MQLSFVKMQGLGNDFIVIDGRNLSLPNLNQTAKQLCHRRLGIGADQLLVLGHSSCADFSMQVFNADGSQVQMCGNGIRCLARYIREQGLSEKDELVIETPAGIIKPRLLGDEVEVDMGPPVLEGELIPVAAEGQIINYPLPVNGREFKITCVSMGNPHCVIFVNNVADFPLTEHGSIVETHSFFPERTNVEFIEVLSPTEIKMRVWERGAGETPACGTGACAAVVACVLNQKAQRRVTVSLPGGQLHIHWHSENQHVYMRGPAVTVFRGRVEI